MMSEHNPVVKQIKEAHATKHYKKTYYITVSSYGRYAIKDYEGIVYGTYSDVPSAVEAKDRLEETS